MGMNDSFLSSLVNWWVLLLSLSICVGTALGLLYGSPYLIGDAWDSYTVDEQEALATTLAFAALIAICGALGSAVALILKLFWLALQLAWRPFTLDASD